jgi:hypothetical protein
MQRGVAGAGSNRRPAGLAATTRYLSLGRPCCAVALVLLPGSRYMHAWMHGPLARVLRSRAAVEAHRSDQILS